MCFRARKNLRSLDPVINDFFYDYDGEIYPGMVGVPRFPDIFLTVEEKSRKKTSTRKK